MTFITSICTSILIASLTSTETTTLRFSERAEFQPLIVFKDFKHELQQYSHNYMYVLALNFSPDPNYILEKTKTDWVGNYTLNFDFPSKAAFMVKFPISDKNKIIFFSEWIESLKNSTFEEDEVQFPYFDQLEPLEEANLILGGELSWKTPRWRDLASRALSDLSGKLTDIDDEISIEIEVPAAISKSLLNLQTENFKAFLSFLEHTSSIDSEGVLVRATGKNFDKLKKLVAKKKEIEEAKRQEAEERIRQAEETERKRQETERLEQEAEAERLRQEAEDKRKAQEAEDKRKAQEAEDKRKAQEAEDKRRAQEAEDKKTGPKVPTKKTNDNKPNAGTNSSGSKMSKDKQIIMSVGISVPVLLVIIFIVAVALRNKAGRSSKGFEKTRG